MGQRPFTKWWTEALNSVHVIRDTIHWPSMQDIIWLAKSLNLFNHFFTCSNFWIHRFKSWRWLGSVLGCFDDQPASLVQTVDVKVVWDRRRAVGNEKPGSGRRVAAISKGLVSFLYALADIHFYWISSPISGIRQVSAKFKVRFSPV